MSNAQEQYVVRRKVLKIFGAAFHVYDEHNSVIGYCKQKALKLREDIRLYTSEDMSEPLLTLGTQQIIDFGATNQVTLPEGDVIGSLRRKGMKSTFVRDEWLIFNAENEQIATIKETGSIAPFARRYIDYANILLPEKYDIIRTRDQQVVAELKQRFNPFIFRLGLRIIEPDEDMDDLLLLGATCLMAAIEGRD